MSGAGDIAASAEKYQTMTRAYDRGAEDGSRNLPPTNAYNLSETELEIVQLAQADIRTLSEREKAESDQTGESIRKIESQIPELSYNPDAFRTDAEIKLNDADRELLRLYDNVASRNQEYRYFKAVHRLSRDADVSESMALTISLLVLVMVIDGVFNAFLFKDASPYALVGGFVFAFILSGANTLIGFAVGSVPWRYLQHRNKLHRIWAFPIFLFLFVAIVLFNIAVGHYRDLLILNKDAQATQAIEKFIQAPVGFHSLPSILLVVVGIAIAMVAARSGYSIFDSYPGFGRSYNRRETAKNRYEEKIKDIKREINKLALTSIEIAQVQYRKTNKAIQSCIGQLDDAIARNKNYAEACVGVESACDAAVQVYRNANNLVRDSALCPPPAYFSRAVILAKPKTESDLRDFQREREKFQERALSAKNEFEEYSKTVLGISKKLLAEESLNARILKLQKSVQQSRREDQAAEKDIYTQSVA